MHADIALHDASALLGCAEGALDAAAMHGFGGGCHGLVLASRGGKKPGRRAGCDLGSSQGPDRTTHICVGRGPCAHLTGTFVGSILVLHGLAAPSGWPEAGGLRVKSVPYFVGISGGISSAIGYG